ncbi:DUF4113 domain-containing protein [Hymenobacter sp.]|uniref:DUF4113 domain-containing protein n=1 Tax=Hymenobacter sp. TaxID=1898978 RepID=UPI00286C7E21|nr:DUF4113 domain-containing protein [Hymenobacter sp.]
MRTPTNWPGFFAPLPCCEVVWVSLTLLPRTQRLMQRLDALNTRFGKGSVQVTTALGGAVGQPAPWKGQQQRRTPAYTTNLG